MTTFVGGSNADTAPLITPLADGTGGKGISGFSSLDFSGDHDWFKVHLTAGKDYLFTMRGVDSNQGNLPDPFLTLLGTDGLTVLNFNDTRTDGLHDSEVIWHATATADYYLVAQASNDSDTGTYALAIGERADTNVTTKTGATVLDLYNPLAGIIGSPTDVDWFKIDLLAGHTYALDMVGLGNRGSLPDGKLTLSGPGITGSITDNNNGVDDDARIIYTPTVNGTFYLKAASNDTAPGSTTGTYWMYAGEQTGLNYMDSELALFDQSWAPDVDKDAHGDFKWTITYSFMSTAPSYATAANQTQFHVLSNTEEDAIRQALFTWSSLTNITFVELPDSNDSSITMRFGGNEGGENTLPGGVAGFGYYPEDASRSLNGGDVWLNVNDSTYDHVAPGEYGYMVLLHEIGHALGLKHPGNYDGDMAPFLPASGDSREWTVMSYNADTTTGVAGLEPITPMLNDIDAIQYLYGVNTMAGASAVVGGTGGNGDATTYDTATGWFPNDHAVLEAIWDPSGTDTFDLHDHTEKMVIDLREYHMSSIGYGGIEVHNNVGIANGAVIEKAIGGSGADSIIGNPSNNTLTGNGGNDTINGGSGKDVLTGGAGADQFLFIAKAVASSTDTIKDFSHAQGDRIVLDNDFFPVMGAVANTAAGHFYSATTITATSAAGTHTGLLYDSDSGNLYYDPTGGSGADRVLIATLTTHPALVAGDFKIVE